MTNLTTALTTTLTTTVHATLHLLGVEGHTHDGHRRSCSSPRERGSVTIETVVWAIAVIAIAGIVVLAITTYVTNQSALIK